MKIFLITICTLIFIIFLIAKWQHRHKTNWWQWLYETKLTDNELSKVFQRVNSYRVLIVSGKNSREIELMKHDLSSILKELRSNIAPRGVLHSLEYTSYNALFSYGNGKISVKELELIFKKDHPNLTLPHKLISDIDEYEKLINKQNLVTKLEKGKVQVKQEECNLDANLKTKRQIKNGNCISEGSNDQEQRQSDEINELNNSLEDDFFNEHGEIKSSISDKILKLNFTESQIDRGCMYVFIIFKNLNGVSFNNVKIAPQNTYPTIEFYNQMTNDWCFGILSYACLFKSFSDDSYIHELDSLLKINEIKKNQVNSKLSDRIWLGNGFIIQHINLNNKNFILISNENVINSERIVASIRPENKEFKEFYNKNNEIAVNPNDMFFVRENMVLAKIFGVQTEDLKDIAVPLTSNEEILIGTFNGSILPYTEEQLLNGISNIEFLHFRNLKGVEYHNIKLPKPHSGDPEGFFKQDINGSWYFTVMNFSMLFKSFSEATFDIELNKLLTANNFDIEKKISEISRDYWVGENFNIEIPKVSSNLIIVSNEKITNSNALEIRETSSAHKIDDLEWIDGFSIYDYDDFTKNQTDVLKAINVPLYFKLPNENEGSIIITVPTEAIGKNIIDQVINKNGGHINFRSTKQDKWTNLFKGYEFVIGYFPARGHVRINQLPSLKVESLDHELRMRIYEFDDAFFMDKYDMDKEEVEIEYWYNIILNRCTGLGSKEFAKTTNKDKNELMLEYIWGHANEYEVKHSDKDSEYKKRICLMRILCFGYIYKSLFEFNIKLDEFIEKNKFDDPEYKEEILFRLIHSKASVYGTIKFALSSNISEDEIREWFPSFEFDESLIEGIDPMSNFGFH